jgi:uncharacterized protein with HEPN domain
MQRKFMPPDRDDDRILHMLTAASKAMNFIEGHTRSDLDDDEKLTLALTRLLEIVGEAATHVSEARKQSMPSIPWRQAIAMRNRLIHGYDGVDLDVLWGTVAENLPPLAAALKAVVLPPSD